MKNLIIWVVLMKINEENITAANFFVCQKLKSRVFLHPAQTNLAYFLRGFSLSSCP
jgi:hypothetical protein